VLLNLISCLKCNFPKIHAIKCTKGICETDLTIKVSPSVTTEGEFMIIAVCSE